MRSLQSKKIKTITFKGQESLKFQEIRSSQPKEIHSVYELVRDVAIITYNNRDYSIFYRGQSNEHLVKSKADGALKTSLYPGIYRLRNGSKDKTITEVELFKRYEILNKASMEIIDIFKSKGYEGVSKLSKFRELVWAIIQHYEICPTPLLDITHSLRVASSLALLKPENETGMVFLIGLPNITNSISYSIEEELVNMKLMSICPPIAQRPYFQEGYLVGTFPLFTSRKQPSLDVSTRLIAKFKLVQKNFWDTCFTPIPKEALFPENDELKELIKLIKPLSVKYNYLK